MQCDIKYNNMHCTEFCVCGFEPGCTLSPICTPEEGECDGVGLSLAQVKGVFMLYLSKQYQCCISP